MKKMTTNDKPTDKLTKPLNQVQALVEYGECQRH